MQIFIPTYGRSTKQETLKHLTAAGLTPTLVVQHRECGKYANFKGPVEVLPPEITTIAPTRQYILARLVRERTFCMVDDDLVFYARRIDDRTKLRDITPTELREAFDGIEHAILGGMAHVGFAAREGANRNVDPVLHNTRIMRVLGYDARVLKDLNIRFDEMEVMEDFHVALSLLEKGYPNCILNNYAHNQAGSGAAGGCSHFRTPELHARNAELLARLHPNVVTVVEKTTKGAWGGGTRKDVRIQWKKAYDQAA